MRIERPRIPHVYEAILVFIGLAYSLFWGQNQHLRCMITLFEIESEETVSKCSFEVISVAKPIRI